MIRPSALDGWRSTRRARGVLLGAWAGEIVAALPLAWALASLATPRLQAAVHPSGLTPRQVIEALVQTALTLDGAGGPIGVAFAVTLAAGALWKVLWLGGLAASWPAPGKPSLTAAISAGLPIFFRLARHAVYALALTGALAALALGIGLGPMALASHGPWWVEAVTVGVRALLLILAVALGYSIASRSRWSVAAGRTPLRALASAARAAARRPLSEIMPSFVWLILSRLLAGMWLASRLAGEVRSPAGAGAAGLLLLISVLAGTWLRGALLLAWAPAADDQISRPGPAPTSSPASAPVA
ncbi:MAG: hypothetical protein ACOY3Y_18500 [Acidobacteriota bacterium]